MSRTKEENARLARLCRESLGSLDNELPRREKKVLEQIIVGSYELNVEWAFFGSNDQLALQARLHKVDASAATRSLVRSRVIEEARGNPLRHFRRPMLYRIVPDALIRLGTPKAGGNPFVEEVRAKTAAWLAHAGRAYPLQPDLLAPDPRELDIALAEISRASALAYDPVQNGAPKPGHVAGEVSSPANDDEDEPGRTLLFAEAPLPTEHVSHEEARRKVNEMLARQAVNPDLSERERRVAQEELERRTAVVKKILTSEPASKKISNQEPLAYQISGCSDGELNSPSGNLDGDARGPVRKLLTAPDHEPPTMVQVLTLLTKLGDPWKPPTAAEALFDELRACMGGAMQNYGGWWWPKCQDPEQRRDVVEAIATWKLARHQPRHKPWRGGAWRDEFRRRQNARLAAAEAASNKPS